MKNLIFVLSMSFFLVACSDEDAVKDAVRARLKDPESVKFGTVTIVKGDKVDGACLTVVNARNSSGGNVISKEAMLARKKDGKWGVSGIEEISHSQCVSAINKVISSN